MTIEPVDALRHAQALAREHGETGMYDLAARVGADVSDVDFKVELVNVAQEWSLSLDLPEAVAECNMGQVLSSVGAMVVYGFLAGALWKTQQEEEDE